MGRRLALFAICLTAAVVPAAPALGGEGPSSVTSGNLGMAFDAGVSPRARTERFQPALLSFGTKFIALDESHLPALRQFVLESDENLAYDFKDVPACPKTGSLAIPTVDVLDLCQRAIVGTGATYFEIAYPMRTPSADTGKTFIFNGGLKNGRRQLFLYRTLSVPTPTTILASIDIEPSSAARFRTRLVLSLPKVVGGSGSLSSMSLALGKGVLARCRTPQLRFRASAEFADGSHLAVPLSRRCPQR